MGQFSVSEEMVRLKDFIHSEFNHTEDINKIIGGQFGLVDESGQTLSLGNYELHRGESLYWSITYICLNSTEFEIFNFLMSLGKDG